MKTTVEQVRDRIQSMLEARKKELEEIQAKINEETINAHAAAAAIDKAVDSLDVDAHMKAKAAEARARTALDMYRARREKISKREYITEAESDKVVDSLLDYENTLAEDFKAAAAVHLRKLAELLRDYKEAVQDTENTLTRWQQVIHANYNTRGRTAFYDESTGTYTNRSKTPVPVHNLPFTGCEESTRMEKYLEKEKALIAED